MSENEKLTPLIAESYELYEGTKKKLKVLGIKTFKGLAQRKRSTFLMQIPDLSVQAFSKCESALEMHGLDFVPDEVISLQKCSGLRFKDLSQLWKRGIVSWQHLGRESTKTLLIGHDNITFEAFKCLEVTAISLGRKPPYNGFRELDISAVTLKWLIYDQSLFNIRDLQNVKFGSRCYSIRKGSIEAGCRREVLYRLWEHGIELSHYKKKRKTP